MSSIEELRKVEEARRATLEKISKDPYMGFKSFDEALDSCKLTSQPEALARLLKRENLFISGLAGSGKTTVINRFIELIDAEYSGAFNIAVTASTGIAATLIGGTTIHSWAGLGVSNEPFNPKSIDSMMWSRSNNLKNADVLIIDEISMLPAHLFTKLDAAFKFFRRNKEPFGGVQLVLIGDFLQLPPVVGRDEADVDNRFAIETDAWQEANIGYCFLDKTYRATDNRLRKILLEIASGKVSQRSKDIIANRIHQSLNPNIVYTTLFTTNKNVDKFNQEQLDLNPNPIISSRLLPMFGSAKDIGTLIKRYNLPEVLELKTGATVILTKNMMTDSGLIANGSLGVIIGFRNRSIPIVKFNSGGTHFIPKALYSITVKEEYTDPVSGKKATYERIIASVEQTPLKLGYAITVHKSQGQTFDGVVLDLSKCFQPGLGYVALSRVRSVDDLVITGFSEKAWLVSPKSQKISTYAKKRALLARREIEEDPGELDNLITSNLLRLMYWDTDKANGSSSL